MMQVIKAETKCLRTKATQADAAVQIVHRAADFEVILDSRDPEVSLEQELKT